MTTTTKKPADDEAGADEQAAKLTASDVMDTLTGFDEIAIEQAFGEDVSRLAHVSVGKFGRALAFVLARRGGMKDAEAKKHVLGLTRREVEDMFADDEGGDLPGSEAGKDEG